MNRFFFAILLFFGQSAIADQSLWQTIVLANATNESACTGLLYCEEVERREFLPANFHQQLINRHRLVLLSNIEDLREAGRHAEADQAEADLESDMAEYQRARSVAALNQHQQFSRDRTLDVIGSRIRDQLRDSRDNNRIVAEQALDANQALNFRVDRTEIWRPDKRITLYDPDLAVLRSPYTMEIEIARIHRGLLPAFVLQGMVTSCSRRETDTNLVDVEGELGPGRFLLTVRADLNYRIVECRVLNASDVCIQHYQMSEFEAMGARVLPRRTSLSVYNESGETSLIITSWLDSVQVTSIAEDVWNAPLTFRLQDLRATPR